MSRKERSESNLWLIKKVVQNHIEEVPREEGIKLELKKGTPVTLFHQGLHTISNVINFNAAKVLVKQRKPNDYLEINFPERRLAREIGVMRSAAGSKDGPAPFGLYLILQNNDQDSRKGRWRYFSLPILPRGTKILSLYMFEEGERNYGHSLEEREKEETITADDIADMDVITDKGLMVLL